jgi:hypothetical protein
VPSCPSSGGGQRPPQQQVDDGVCAPLVDGAVVPRPPRHGDGVDAGEDRLRRQPRQAEDEQVGDGVVVLAEDDGSAGLGALALLLDLRGRQAGDAVLQPLARTRSGSDDALLDVDLEPTAQLGPHLRAHLDRQGLEQLPRHACDREGQHPGLHAGEGVRQPAPEAGLLQPALGCALGAAQLQCQRGRQAELLARVAVGPFEQQHVLQLQRVQGVPVDLAGADAVLDRAHGRVVRHPAQHPGRHRHRPEARASLRQYFASEALCHNDFRRVRQPPRYDISGRGRSLLPAERSSL